MQRCRWADGWAPAVLGETGSVAAGEDKGDEEEWGRQAVPAHPSAAVSQRCRIPALPHNHASKSTTYICTLTSTTQPPPFLVQVGCVAVVAPSARARTLGAGFDLSELHMKPVAQVGRSCGSLVVVAAAGCGVF